MALSRDRARSTITEGSIPGGLTGGMIALALQRVAGPVGAIVILSAAIVAELILIFNLSLSRAIERTADALGHTGRRVGSALSEERRRLAARRGDIKDAGSDDSLPWIDGDEPAELSGAASVEQLPTGDAADASAAGSDGEADAADLPWLEEAQIPIHSWQDPAPTGAVDDGPVVPDVRRRSGASRLDVASWQSEDERARQAQLRSATEAAEGDDAGFAAVGASRRGKVHATPAERREAERHQPILEDEDEEGVRYFDDVPIFSYDAEPAGRIETIDDTARAAREAAELEGDADDIPAFLRPDERARETGAPSVRPVTLARSGTAAATAEAEQAVEVDAAAKPKPEKPSVERPAARTAATKPAVAAEEEEIEEAPPYRLPPISLLSDEDDSAQRQNQARIAGVGRKLEETLASFGVEARVVNITTGPAITRFELSPGLGVKVSRIVNLSDDIALSLAAVGVRIEAPIPGKSAIGIEIPNKETTTVGLRPLIESLEFRSAKSPLAVALGRDIPGAPLLCDLTSMPHLLIAGATGSGKSVCINVILTSILYRSHPDDVKMLLIDPKVVELSIYNGIPHLLAPVVTDPKKASNTLRWAVVEMGRRYELFASRSVRDIKNYNRLMDEEEDGERLPLILIVIDELSDLMNTAANEVEDSIARLTAMARAAGMHLIIATQRPSVDVITGVIKANIPSRIAFMVSSQVDSRTILDMGGAEKLLGRGDMLYAPQSTPKPKRGQGALISEQEVERVVAWCSKQNLRGYDEKLSEEIVSSRGDGAGADGEPLEQDELFEDAVEIILDAGYASVSILQRRMNVGYPRAGKLIDQMEQAGYIGPFEGSKPRKLLLKRDEWDQRHQRGSEGDDDEA